MPSRRAVRVACLTVIVGSAAILLGMNVAVPTPAGAASFAPFADQTERPAGERDAMAAPRDGVTVVTAHADEAGDIVALAPNGTVLYHDDSHDGYFDVDPSPDGRYTVVYTATDEVHDEDRCEPVGSHQYCVRQLIERANLSTGEVEVLYERIDPRYHSSEWHDVDRIDDARYVVADMYADEVFVVNVETGMVVWEWTVQRYLPLTSGGSYPSDWVHLNDVEVLDDGRFMVSLRNQDQVVFVDREAGVDDAWTLGADDDHETLYEPHNPDYLPAAQGGPAVLVADSENNRVVEYRRSTSGTWDRTWVWRDRDLQWPRDADRLPNGNTLITDTHGGRVIEVDPQGAVEWQLDVPRAYEAERLNTGDESRGGPTAARAGLESRGMFEDPEGSKGEFSADVLGALDRIRVGVRGLFPTKLVNALAHVTPPWLAFFDLVVVTVGGATSALWLAVELKWSRYRLRSPLVRAR